MAVEVLAAAFGAAGLIAPFFVKGRPSRVVLILSAIIAGFSASTAIVILQHLVLGHFFGSDLLPQAERPLDLLTLAGINGAAFFLGYLVGEVAERFVAPWREAPRPPTGSNPPEKRSTEEGPAMLSPFGGPSPPRPGEPRP